MEPRPDSGLGVQPGQGGATGGVPVAVIAEFLPFAAYSVVVPSRHGREPGSFTKIGKVSSRL